MKQTAISLDKLFMRSGIFEKKTVIRQQHTNKQQTNEQLDVDENNRIKQNDQFSRFISHR